MPLDSASDHQSDDSESEFVEIDPTGRYGRYKEILGRGAFKKVYRGFDQLEGIEVAWNQVKLTDLLRNSEDLERLYSEVHLLKTLKHKNIIKFYVSWVDTKHDNINFITEIFTSGTLRQYRKKHKHVDLRALKKWSSQILEGLLYLHSHDPPVIHRDLKCDNVFVNGNQGEVKIGDLGLAAILCQAHSAHSVIGTPEFMAPELYEEDYNELVDIYAFGMCVLELVTFEYPYAECANAAQIFKKVTSGIKPASLAKVTDPIVKGFIEKCIGNVSERLPAKELLMDPFLLSNEASESTAHSSISRSQYSGGNLDKVDSASGKDSLNERSSGFRIHSQRKDINTIFLKLQIADSTGHIRNIHFPFDVEEDTALAVATEMVEQLDLTNQDVSTIATMIDSEIRSHVPDWTPTEFSQVNVCGESATSNSHVSDTNENSSLLRYNSARSSSSLALERLPSGKKYWSDSPNAIHELSPLSHKDQEYHLNDVVSPNQGGSGTIISRDGDHSDENDQGREVLMPCEQKYGNENMSMESEDAKEIAEKLEHLLLKQRKELHELKTKHRVAIKDLMKEVSTEIRKEVLKICELRFSDEFL